MYYKSKDGIKMDGSNAVVQFETSDLTIAMEEWKPALLKAMPPLLNIM
jgi:hypothetical protein